MWEEIAKKKRDPSGGSCKGQLTDNGLKYVVAAMKKTSKHLDVNTTGAW